MLRENVHAYDPHEDDAPHNGGESPIQASVLIEGSAYPSVLNQPCEPNRNH